MANSDKIVKNSVMMYGRMIITMIVTLYTSRIVLGALGIADYGIYNLVSGIVVMFNSIRTVFCSSTQRFINYEIGQGNMDKLSLVFNMSIVVNFIIAIVFILLVEIVGLWFIYNDLNIEPNRFFAANVVFQLSVITAAVGLVMTPFDAVIISHERMDYYAGMAIIEVLGRLGIAMLLVKISGDKLIAYASMIFLIQIVVYSANFFFCRYNFDEVRFKKMWDKTYFKNMTVFAGWNFLGNTAFALTQSGMNMVLNVFGGPIVNAARGIAFQVNTVLQQAINNIGIVIKPYAIQTYAKNEKEKAFEILYLSSKIYYTIQILLVIIFSFFTREIIQLWLGQVPEYVVSFLILILWYSLARALHNPIDILFFSVGDIKYYQICEGIILSSPILLSYIALKIGCPFYSAFIIQLLIEILNLFIISFIAKRVCNLDIIKYVRMVFVPCSLSFIIYLISFYMVNYRIDSYVLKFLNTAIALLIQLIFMFYIGCTAKERNLLKRTIKKIIKK